MTLSFRLFLTTALLAVVACGTNPPPATKPSASPSVKPSMTPSPSASASEFPTPEPTPVPESTPFPTGTPRPSATPLPTPTPVFGSGNTQTTLDFRARVISEGREVLPVSKTSFTAAPYDLAELKTQLAARNGVEAQPQEPMQSDEKYQISEKICTSSGCTTRTTVDIEAYQDDLSRYQESILPEWEKRAYKGLNALLDTVAGDRKILNFTTDSAGEAVLKLAVGKWYISGKYTVNGTQIIWESIPFDVTATTKALDLIR